MNSRPPDRDLESLREAYHESRYPGRLAEDAEETNSVLSHESETAVERARFPNTGERKRQLLYAVAVASAAMIAFVLFRLATQPRSTGNTETAGNAVAVDKKGLVDEKGIVDRTGSAGAIARSVTDDVRADTANDGRATTLIRPLDPSQDQQEPFRIFVVAERDRADTSQSSLASAFRGNKRRSEEGMSEPAFSLFPSSITPPTSTRDPNEYRTDRRRKFDLFPSRSRSSKNI
ncbi:MAG: hypothetical protein AAF497_25375 [Planctomycetota bacterium]